MLDFLLFVAAVILFVMAGVAIARTNRLREEMERLRTKLGKAIERLERIESSQPPAPPKPAEAPAAKPPLAVVPPVVKPAAPPPPPIPTPVAPAAYAPPPPAPAAPPAPPKPAPEPTLARVVDAVKRPAPVPPAPPIRPVAPKPAAGPPATPPAPRPASKWLDAEGLISWAKVEDIIGKRWMTWAGVLAIFVAVALFASYAFQKGWIGPWTQILAALGAGLVLSGLGVHFLRKGMRPFGQGLLGGGIMVLYAALFCAYSPGIYEHPPIDNSLVVFALMCVVTAAGMAAAVAFDALPIAFLAILGGVLTPVLVSRGTNERDGLFAYLMLLDLGVLGVAFYKKWRALDVLAFLGTVVLFGGWFLKFYDGHPDYAATALVGTTVWLLAFYAVFLVLPFVNHFITRTELTIERFAMALTNATVAFVGAWRLLHDGNTDALAGVSCLMSVSYLALGVVSARRIPDDRKSLFAFIALSVSLLTIAIPVYFQANGITVGWTVEAVALLYLAYQFRYMPARWGAFIILLMAIGRVYWEHWDKAMGHEVPFTLILNREFLILMCAPLGAAACAVVHHLFRRDALEPDAAIKRIEAVGAGLMFLGFLHVELGQWLQLHAAGWHRNPDYLRACSLSMMWALGAAAFLGSGRAIGRSWVTWIGLAPLAVAAGHAVWLYSIPDANYLLFLNARFWSALIVAGVLFGFAFAPTTRESRTGSIIFAGYTLLLLISMEVGLWASGASAVHAWNAHYVSWWPVAMVLAAGACLFFIAGARREGGEGLSLAGLLPALVAGVFCVMLYAVELDKGFTFLLNFRFFAGLALAAAAVVGGLSSRRSTATLVGCIIAGWIGILLMTAELWRWLEWMEQSRQWPFGYAFAWSLSVVWSAGALAFLAAWRWKKAPAAFAAGMPALIFALIFAAAGFFVRGPEGALLAINWRFAAAALAVAAAFAYSLLSPAGAGIVAGCSLSGYVSLAFVTAEVWTWIDRVAKAHEWNRDYTLLWSLALVWAAGATAFLAVRWWRKSAEALGAGLPALGIALIIAGVGYTAQRSDAYLFALNTRFLVALAAVAVTFAYSLAPDERGARVIGCVFAGYCFLVLVHAEMWFWVAGAFGKSETFSAYDQLWPVTLLWAIGAGVYFWMARRLAAKEAYLAGLAPLGVGIICAIALHVVARHTGAAPLMLFINARFLTSFALAAAGFFGVALLYNDKNALGESEVAIRRLLLWATTLGLLVLLSVDPYRWCIRNVSDPERAKMMAQMSLSVVWAAYAAVVLGAGFYKRTRAIRFAALGLFALTGLKLVFVDLSGIGQLYRIVSFLTLGILMIGSAYLYNKAEGWLKESDAPKPWEQQAVQRQDEP